jgi:hypothetical protein
MVTALALTALLACAPAQYRMPPPPPPVATACEGADRVMRNDEGLEVGRVQNACTTVRCEGGDRVRRTYEGVAVWRTANACTIARCEGRDYVVRTTEGMQVSRWSMRCMPPEPQRPQQSDVLRYGLSYR